MDVKQYSMTENREESFINIMELIAKLWQHKIMISAITIICAVAAFVNVTYFTANTYTASGILYISNKKDEAAKDDTIQKNDIDTSRSLSSACIEILKTDSFLDSVARKNDDYSGKDILKIMNISALNETELLKISVKTQKAADSYRIVETIMEKAPDKILSIYKNGEVVVVDPPKYPFNANDKGMMKNTLIGAFAGFLISAFIVFVRMLFDTEVHSTEAVSKRYGIFSLGELPE